MARLSRRALLGGIGAALGSAAGCLSLDRSEFGPADWPLLQADPGQTNYSPASGPVEDAEIVWSRPILTKYRSKPLFLSDGTLYTLFADGEGKYLSEQLSLHGIDAETGETQFRVPDVTQLFALGASTSYENGMILGRGTGTYDHGAMLGINPDDGPAPRRWTHERPGVHTFRHRSPVDSQTVLEGTWYYTTRSPPGPNEILAVDVDDGRTRWRRQFDTDTDWSLAATDGRLVSTIDHDESPSTIRTLDPDDGHTLREVSGGQWSRSMASDRTVYVTASSRLGAYDVDSLEQQWESRVGPADIHIWASAIGPERIVIALGRPNDGEPEDEIFAVALDRDTGDEQWRERVLTVDADRQSEGVSISIGSETVYFAAFPDRVAALSMTDGTVRWQIRPELEDASSLSNGSVSEPVVGDGRLYLLISGHGLVALGEP
ncbi:outer membrane protein assembly factor BamB family protein [Halapricum hydrolyticum]|uniref:PQQ-like beta-propeller repeat protein n=1 Tax=Halapricum hydrolyticum TaxID=2979991 RepID=A0AAE3I8R3_9EURY|nr:PQQ-binding-like beta-propeller repeat protein [Halapricum hydrolyticum]MCU4716584.1 PQQ-like beta-propeller repeat protein [Halapricum hydrolyticum]MCU4725811.1 PQQ-like beta-propeller repeat protein [Halapricum hydrolyticum]